MRAVLSVLAATVPVQADCANPLHLVSCGVQAAAGGLQAATGAVVGSAASSTFDAMSGWLVAGFADATRIVLTFWTGVGTPGLQAGGDAPIRALQADTAWLTAWVAVLSVLVCAARTAMTRSGRPAGEAVKGLVLLVVVSGAGVAAVQALVHFGDAYSGWVLQRSAGPDLGARITGLAGLGPLAGLGSGLVLVVALLGIVASLAQVGLLVVRIAVLTIFAGLLPLAAAGTSTQTGMDWFKRIVAWLLAFTLYKPVAATVYATAFLLIGKGTDGASVLAGLFLLLLSVLALPSLLRLVTPMVGAAVAAGAGGGAGLAAASVGLLATGARAGGLAGGGGSAGSSGPGPMRPTPQGAPPGGSQPGRGGAAGGSAAGGDRAAGAASAGGGGGSGAAGAGAAGLVQAGAQAVTAARQGAAAVAADGAASGATSGAGR